MTIPKTHIIARTVLGYSSFVSRFSVKNIVYKIHLWSSVTQM